MFASTCTARIEKGNRNATQNGNHDNDHRTIEQEMYRTNTRERFVSIFLHHVSPFFVKPTKTTVSPFPFFCSYPNRCSSKKTHKNPSCYRLFFPCANQRTHRKAAVVVTKDIKCVECGLVSNIGYPVSNHFHKHLCWNTVRSAFLLVPDSCQQIKARTKREQCVHFFVSRPYTVSSSVVIESTNLTTPAKHTC